MHKLITNNQSSNFYNHLLKNLISCNSFIINVAFINFSGLQLLLDTFKNLEKSNIKGKILTSTYLNFTEVKALEKLREFKNIELKIYDSNEKNIGFHAKAYIFEFENTYKVLLGSSNITASALKSNVEWNVDINTKKDDLFLIDTLKEFDSLWKESFFVEKNFLDEYKLHKEKLKNTLSSNTFSFKKTQNINFMQERALLKLEEQRANNKNKALVIAATGSGKTYLAAYDVKKMKPNKLLFLVHRENILIKAKESFEKILENNISCGLYTGNKKELKSDYLFATIQTMSLDYLEFSQKSFDYIIIDEAHHVTSPSYKKVIDYFDTNFLLGLTATPNRMDNNCIYEVFDNNIACDIRLNDALEHKLVTPFHYYGITDIESIDYKEVDIHNINEVSKLLRVNERVDLIIEKMNFYSYSGRKRKVLAFCVSKEHSIYMSEEFNKRGISSTYLTSNESIEKREEAIKNLSDENNSLEVIFTIDIFNEGVDIPSVNTVLLLRPTSSPIVFMQQLGRGLRKSKQKEFLTVLDFIGNHNKIYLIALALLGGQIIDKESIKISLLNNFANMQNIFIQMDEISKQRILEQIDSQNFNNIKYLKEQYLEFKVTLNNKIPSLVDYIHDKNLVNPKDFIDNSKSYIEFLAKVEKNIEFEDICKNSNFIKAIRFIQNQLPLKRVYEFVILRYLLLHDSCDINIAFDILQAHLKKVCKDTIVHSFNYLNEKYFDKGQTSRYLKLVDFDGNKIVKSKEFKELVSHTKLKEIIEDSLNYGILIYEEEYGNDDYGMPFLKLYSKYNMLDIAQLCNFPKIHSSFRGSGFLKYEDDFFLFINLEKEKFSKSANYHNTFLSKDIITYQSKPSMSQEKGDGIRLIDNIKYGVKLHIFVRKFAQVDKKTQNFIYLGLCNTQTYEGNKPISLELKLEISLSNNLYEEFTRVV